VAENKSVDFALQMHPSLPASMFTDAKRLQQVIKNLLSNAFKFTAEGGVSFRARRAHSGWSPENESLNRADEVIAFAVRDTGIGIPADLHHIIFEPFQQADGSTNRKYGGTGLGLAISREIAYLLGGEIRLESAPGEGSTFTLYLPVTYVPRPSRRPGIVGAAALPAGNWVPARIAGQGKAESAFAAEFVPALHVSHPGAVNGSRAIGVGMGGGGNGDEALAEEETPMFATDFRSRFAVGGDSSLSFPEPDPALAGRKVLVVDDDVRNVFAMTCMLEESGMRVVSAETGQAALDLLEETPDVDVVLMDIMMPGMDGYETIQTIRKLGDFRPLPIIAVTAKAMPGDREKCLEAGASDYMSKPVQPVELLSLLSKWVAR
jgi:CheY-like chemotaxis protein